MYDDYTRAKYIRDLVIIGVLAVIFIGSFFFA